ncbi:MAG: hypothetical protein R3F46_01275 [bacterium]
MAVYGPDHSKIANFLNAMLWMQATTSLSFSELFAIAERQQEHGTWFYDESETNAEIAKANEYLKDFSKAMQDEDG